MPDDNDISKPDRAELLVSQISIYSHEFRTPATKIAVYADLLLKDKAGPLNQKQTEWITIIHKTINQLIELNNIFVSTAFDSGSNQSLSDTEKPNE